MYGSPFRPQFRKKGAPISITKPAEDSLIACLNEQPWALQREMAWFLWEEWGFLCTKRQSPGFEEEALE